MYVPCGPQLDSEERSPADDISQNYDHCHLQRLHPGLGHAGHTGGSGWKRETHAALLLNLLVQVDLDGSTDAHLTNKDCNNR